MTYDDILKVFYNPRKDYSFPSSALDNLTEKERRVVESMIVKSCLNGDGSCFQHLSKLKYYDPTQIFSLDVIQRMESSKRVRILEILYDINHDKKYIDYLLQLSSEDLGAFSMLTIMYEDGRIDSSYLDKMMDMCQQESDKKEYYMRMIKRVVSEEQLEQHGLKHGQAYYDASVFNHDKMLYDMLTGKAPVDPNYFKNNNSKKE